MGSIPGNGTKKWSFSDWSVAKQMLFLKPFWEVVDSCQVPRLGHLSKKIKVEFAWKKIIEKVCYWARVQILQKMLFANVPMLQICNCFTLKNNARNRKTQRFKLFHWQWPCSTGLFSLGSMTSGSSLAMGISRRSVSSLSSSLSLPGIARGLKSVSSSQSPRPHSWPRSRRWCSWPPHSQELFGYWFSLREKCAGVQGKLIEPGPWRKNSVKNDSLETDWREEIMVSLEKDW